MGIVYYLVGGAVRDKLLGREAHDRDYMVTGATVEEMRAKYGAPVGGLFPVFLDDEGNEIAMARRERKKGEGHRGFEIEFGPHVTVEDDLLRRDFTINAMAMTASGKIIDPYGGRADIERKVLRAVSVAFAEDPLRVFRLARFAAQLNFSVDPGTADMARALRGELKTLPAERVVGELLKALASVAPWRFFEVLREVDALDVFFPEVAALATVPAGPTVHHAEGHAFIHTMMVLRAATEISKDTLVRFGALVHDLGKAETPQESLPAHPGHEKRGVALVKALARRLRGLGQEYARVGVKAAEEHLRIHRACEARAATLHDMIHRLRGGDKADLDRVCLVAEADARGRKPSTSSMKAIRRVLKSAEAYDTVTGADVIERYGVSGVRVGDMLRQARIAKIAVITCEDV